jgi:hypothetical protein
MMTREQANEFFSMVLRASPSTFCVREDGDGVFSVSEYVGELGLSSFDNDTLTRLVLAAHERCVRVWVTPGQPKHLRLNAQARDPASFEMAHAHPTIAEAIAKFARHDGVDWPRELAKKRDKSGSVAPLVDEAVARWATMTPGEQWAMLCHQPKILGPWEPVGRADPPGTLDGHWARYDATRTICAHVAGEGDRWFSTVLHTHTKIETSRERAMAWVDEMLRSDDPAVTLVGGVIEDGT